MKSTLMCHSNVHMYLCMYIKVCTCDGPAGMVNNKNEHYMCVWMCEGKYNK